MKTFLLFLLSIVPTWALSQSSRIIGGQIANAGQFPHAAAIYKTTANGNYFCAGSLLKPQWVLTAGQCVEGATMFTVVLGTHILNGDNATSEKLSTDEYVLHPDYNPLTLQNDVGLIKFRAPVTLTLYVGLLYLPFAALWEGSGGIAVGWGQTSDADSSISNSLNWVSLVSVTEAECKQTYGNQIFENMVCFEGNYNEGACLGDSGSPVIQQIKQGYSIALAISSFYSANGCESTDPSGYTKIYPYIDWIQNYTLGQ